MSLDGRILAAAKAELAENRRGHEAQTAERRSGVYRRSPRIAEIDATLRELVIEASAAALRHGSDPATSIEALADESLDLQEERAAELARLGYPADYLDDAPMCQICGDSGYHGTSPCACLLDIYSKLQKESLSSLLRLGNETFDSFDLSWYSDRPDPATGMSPRDNMEVVYETCVQYARRFDKHRDNLFLNGRPGLGKTFLSACIARAVSESGHSVVYDMAGRIFTKFEEEKFRKAEDTAAVRAELRRYLECDLLIIDDLGTEMTTAYTTSVLYELINTRLITGRRTVISSNLSLDEIRRRYTEQIVSRLDGEYNVLQFYGDDIRRLKKQK